MSGELALLPLLLSALAIVVGVALAKERRQRNALRDWLLAPDLHPVPDGSGVWAEIFSRLNALRKRERQQRLELGQALERFRCAVQALPDGVILLDAQGRIEWMNDAASRHFALDDSRDIGLAAAQMIRQSEFQELLDRHRQARSPQAAQLRLADGNGVERVLSVTLAPYLDAVTLLVSTDISERVRSEHARRDFIANVSHELRTPLTVITGFLEQFDTAEPPTGEAARSFIRLMSEQAERMNRLVADLLTLSRLESSREPPRDDIVDVAALLESLSSEALALSAGKHTIEIIAACAGKLRGSLDELRSAFGNLVSNAVRYTPPGGRITLAWRLEDGLPTFSVSDTGIGIPAEHIPRLTERFYRVDKGRSTASGGTGLGLAIVKHILARHGGSLHIHSVPGQGSTFSARLPADRIV
ncbi:MAG: phosphate regulon sensor histidine kinase PhoR [Rhodocyclaceae bacterium]